MIHSYFMDAEKLHIKMAEAMDCKGRLRHPGYGVLNRCRNILKMRRYRDGKNGWIV